MSKIAKALEKARKSRQGSEHQLRRETPAEVCSIKNQLPVYTQTQVLTLDENDLEKHRVLMFLDYPQARDCYNLLRTQILQRTLDEGLNTIMVTSVIKGEGKTVTAVNLAVSIAREVERTVLLVDADLRSPRVHRYLGCSMGKGLSDHLLHDAPIPDLLINPGLAKMVVLPAGKPVAGSTEILNSPKMAKLVAEMKGRYPNRYVIFDCPPLLSLPDPLVISTLVDGIILVVQANRTPKDQIRKAVELLDGRNVLGVVMNRGEPPGEYYY